MFSLFGRGMEELTLIEVNKDIVGIHSKEEHQMRLKTLQVSAKEEKEGEQEDEGLTNDGLQALIECCDENCEQALWTLL